jgi:hypothetical protein
MSPGTRREKEKQWLEHVKKAQSHSVGIAAYCRRAGITVNALNYWRAKTRLRPSMPDRDENPVFLPVQVIENEVPDLRSEFLDPKWVAEVMLHLACGMRGRRS